MIVLYSKPPLWCIGELQCTPGDLNVERTLCTTVKKTYGVLLRRAFKVNAVLKPPVTQCSPPKKILSKSETGKSSCRKKAHVIHSSASRGGHYASYGDIDMQKGEKARDAVRKWMFLCGHNMGAFFGITFLIWARGNVSAQRKKKKQQQRARPTTASLRRQSVPPNAPPHTESQRAYRERESMSEGDKDGGSA